jgi:signal transduction histidine kinase
MDRYNARKTLLQRLETAKESARPLESMLLQSEAELQHFMEAEAFERFIGDMALYFRNVFDVVVSYGEIVQMRMEQDDPRQTHAQLILDDAKAGKRLTSDLLRKRGSAALKLLTLDRFIRELALLLSRIVEKRIQLREMLDCTLPHPC